MSALNGCGDTSAGCPSTLTVSGTQAAQESRATPSPPGTQPGLPPGAALEVRTTDTPKGLSSWSEDRLHCACEISPVLRKLDGIQPPAQAGPRVRPGMDSQSLHAMADTSQSTNTPCKDTVRERNFWMSNNKNPAAASYSGKRPRSPASIPEITRAMTTARYSACEPEYARAGGSELVRVEAMEMFIST